MAEKELAILLVAKDLASGPLKKVTAQLDRMEKVGSITRKGIRTAADNLEKLGLVAGGLAVGAGVQAVRWAAEFEAQLNTINTIARQTPEGLRQIGDQIRAVARDSGTSLDELTRGYYDLLSAGVDAAHATDVLRAANTLAIGGLASTAETIDLLTTAINTYGGDASKAAHMADVFAKAIERGKVTAADLAASFATVGPVAAQAGIKLEEIGAAYARLTALGVPAAEAATQVRSAIVALMRRTGALEKLEKQTGKSYLALAGKKGLVAALQELRQDADKAGVPLIDLLGRVEGLNFALATTGPNLKAFQEDLDAMQEAAGAAAGQMSERQQGLSFALARLRANIRDAGIEIGTSLLPTLADLADQLTVLLQQHRGDITRFGTQLGDALRSAARWAKQVDWDKIANGLRVAADLAGRLIKAFASAPPEVQGLVVALAGLNKLSGGAVGGIVSEIGKGLIKGVLGMTAGVVNLSAATVNAPGLAGGGTVVAGGGGRFGRLGRLGGPLARLGIGLAGGAILANLPEAGQAPLPHVAGSALGAAAIGFEAFGVPGALTAGAIGLVAGVRDAIEAGLSRQASTLADQLGQKLDRMNPRQLRDALAGVEKGIRDIKSTPLHTLLAGPALQRLEEMRDALQARLSTEQALLDRLRSQAERPPRDDALSGAVDKLNRILDRGIEIKADLTVNASSVTRRQVVGRRLTPSRAPIAV
jgi:TP901 family phage tail tape measure protein